MSQEYIEALKCFTQEYNTLISQHKYLNKKDIHILIENYQSVLTEIEKYKDFLPSDTTTAIKNILADKNLNWVDQYNKQMIAKTMYNEKEYLDTLFTKYKIPIILDKEQREAIISDDTASLIIAGAGTGKTTTMAAKVKYLVDKHQIAPNEILVISFTNKAVNELKRQIHKNFRLKEVDIRTFHSLGNTILKDKYTSNFKVVTDDQQIPILFNYIKSKLFQNKQEFQRLFQIYSDFFTKDFIIHFEKAKDYDEYFNNYKERKWNRESKNIAEYLKNRELSRIYEDKPRGLDNTIYHSKIEAVIANFFYINNIKYQYEAPAPFKIDENTPYHPDFTIEGNGKKIIIEYFGLMNYQENGRYSKEEIEDYQEKRKNKERELKKHYIDYIFLDDTKYLDVIKKLQVELSQRNISYHQKTNRQIFDSLMEQNPEIEFTRFLADISKSIAKLKENKATIDTFTDIIEFYRTLHTNPIEFQNYKIEILFIKAIYQYYQTYLKEHNLIDYADMINDATDFLKENPTSIHLPHYKYILIDEYQDISLARFLLIKQIIQTFDSKIVAVGDDWQTIYTFAGSNIKLFYNFQKEFPASKEYQITHTYRNSQELIDTAGEFVLKNKEQKIKNLISGKKLLNPIEIVYYQKKRYTDTICQLLDKIHQETPNDNIFILSRRNAGIDTLLKDERFKIKYNNMLIYANHPELKITALTVHKSKGLTCDQAIIIDLKNGIFPSTRMEHNIFYSYYRHMDIDSESFPYAEERRLFYVALTRTKNKVYLMSSNEEKEQSIFINEIKKSEHVLENKSYLTEENLKEIEFLH